MCLTKIDKSKVVVAKKNMIVFKFGTITYNTFISEIKLFNYSKDIPSKKLELTFSENKINLGYHSFPYLEEAKLAKGRRHFIGIFMIPKGATFIDGKYNNKNNLVSTEIVYLGKYTPVSLLNKLKKHNAVLYGKRNAFKNTYQKRLNNEDRVLSYQLRNHDKS